ncbi:ATP-binding protein [Leptolyngbya sp. CCNP1308]|uniref:ATP-binding protein n=1 Tax=Leptolyngbya sp. CCNP1308 TaxID=3110255 RepID=UPI002B1FC5BB|nr:ATP-binding protein [Leptolyngbya sp. CCNP1308]MEA5452415.1 ATP-binding protein [Leptolyngbya sp. CCNP1308]
MPATSGQRSQQGSGLGLFICQEYIRLLGGQLQCQSQPGLGSCFEFTVTVPGNAQALVAIAPASTSSLNIPPILPLQAEHLAMMSQEWCDQLRQAVTLGDDGAVLALLQMLPPEGAELSHWLRRWATDYQFDYSAAAGWVHNGPRVCLWPCLLKFNTPDSFDIQR